MSDYASKNDMMFFQNEVLGDIKKIETKLNSKFEDKTNDINSKLTMQEQKMLLLQDKFHELCETIVTQKENEDKITKIINFKKKTEESMFVYDTKINSLERDLSNAIYKMDQTINNTILVPGLIGNACKYPTVRAFLDFCNKNFMDLNAFKDKNVIDLKAYKTKMESLVSSFNLQIENIQNKFIDYFNKRFVEIENKLLDRIKITDDRIDVLRLENGRYANELIDETKNLAIKWERLDAFEKSINEKINKEFEKFNTSLNNTINKVNDNLNEYKLLKQKFTVLSDFIKDVRFRKNIGQNVSMKEFKEVGKKIDFRKKQKLENDTSKEEDLSDDYNLRNDNYFEKMKLDEEEILPTPMSSRIMRRKKDLSKKRNSQNYVNELNLVINHGNDRRRSMYNIIQKDKINISNDKNSSNDKNISYDKNLTIDKNVSNLKYVKDDLNINNEKNVNIDKKITIENNVNVDEKDTTENNNNYKIDINEKNFNDKNDTNNNNENNNKSEEEESEENDIKNEDNISNDEEDDKNNDLQLNIIHTDEKDENKINNENKTINKEVIMISTQTQTPLFQNKNFEILQNKNNEILNNKYEEKQKIIDSTNTNSQLIEKKVKQYENIQEINDNQKNIPQTPSKKKNLVSLDFIEKNNKITFNSIEEMEKKNKKEQIINNDNLLTIVPLSPNSLKNKKRISTFSNNNNNNIIPNLNSYFEKYDKLIKEINKKIDKNENHLYGLENSSTKKFEELLEQIRFIIDNIQPIHKNKNVISQVLSNYDSLTIGQNNNFLMTAINYSKKNNLNRPRKKINIKIDANKTFFENKKMNNQDFSEMNLLTDTDPPYLHTDNSIKVLNTVEPYLIKKFSEKK